MVLWNLNVNGFINGKVYVKFKPLQVSEGILIVNDRVLLTGSNDTIINIATKMNGQIIDLEGSVIIPGFIDSHIHLDSLGLYLSTLDLRGVRSIEELKNALKNYAKIAKTDWIIGHGWDQENFVEKRWPTRWDLDSAVKDRPVLLTRICLHAGVVNTKALELTGLAEMNMRDVLRDNNGVPTGVLVENALKIARDKVKEFLSVKDYIELIKLAQEHVLSLGVTTVGFVGCGLTSLKALLELWRNHELKIRVRVYLSPYDKLINTIDLLKELGIKHGFGDPHLKIMGVKLFVDGALGPRTAWLSEPYSDDPSTSGYMVTNSENLYRLAKMADEAELQLAIHAIGDKAIDFVLNLYRELKNTKRLRHRIEHLSVIRDDEVEAIRNMGIVAVVQPHFVISDWWAKDRLGEKRIKWLYRFKTIASCGVPLAFSTDAPVEPASPWNTIYAAVTRGKYNNIQFYEDTKHESLELLEALHYYTAGSAYALHDEMYLGSLEPGKFADFVVLDEDPLNVSDVELKLIKIREVYVGGIKVWEI